MVRPGRGVDAPLLGRLAGCEAGVTLRGAPLKVKDMLLSGLTRRMALSMRERSRPDFAVFINRELPAKKSARVSVRLARRYPNLGFPTGLKMETGSLQRA